MAKEPFKWDSERELGEVTEGDKVKHVVKLCTLNGTSWVATSKYVLTKEGWTFKGNTNFKAYVFEHIYKLFESIYN